MVGRKKWGCPIFHSIPLVFLLSRKTVFVVQFEGGRDVRVEDEGFFDEKFAIAES